LNAGSSKSVTLFEFTEMFKQEPTFPLTVSFTMSTGQSIVLSPVWIGLFR